MAALWALDPAVVGLRALPPPLLEQWLSGLKRRFAKPLGMKVSRRFESCLLHIFYESDAEMVNSSGLRSWRSVETQQLLQVRLLFTFYTIIKPRAPNGS